MRHAGLALAAGLMIGGTAWAQALQAPAPESLEAPMEPAPLAEVMERLGSERVADRELASFELLNPGYTEAELLAYLSQGLDPERANRLRAALYDRFKRADHAAIGITFNTRDTAGPRIVGPEDGGPAVRPDFPAGRAGLLREGDLLLEIDGVKFVTRTRGEDGEVVEQGEADPSEGTVTNSTLGMRMVILSRRPGETVPMRLLRDGQEIEVEVELGAWSSLGNSFNARVHEDEYRAAWEHRLRRLGCEVGCEPLALTLQGPLLERASVGLNGVRGMVDEATLGEAVQRGRPGMINPIQRRLVQQARVAAPPRFNRFAGLSGASAMEPRMARGQGVHETVLRGPDGAAETRAATESAALARQLVELEVALAEAGAVSTSPQTDPTVRRRASAHAAELRAQIEAVRQALDQIVAP